MNPRRSGIFLLPLILTAILNGQFQDQRGFTQFYVNPPAKPPVLTERSERVETPKESEASVPAESETGQKAAPQEIAPPDDVPGRNKGRVEDESQRISSVMEKAADNVRHETVRRGDGQDELAAGEYVIAGVFKSKANAKHFSDGLRSLDYAPAYGYGSEKDLWYVYLFKSQDAVKARTQQAKLSKLFLLRDAWLLTVQP
jgi:hypothetical protein